MGGVAAGGRVRVAATGGAPALAVFPNPVEQRALKTDVVAQSFGFQPFVTQDFFPLGQKFLVERGSFHEFAGIRVRRVREGSHYSHGESVRVEGLHLGSKSDTFSV